MYAAIGPRNRPRCGRSGYRRKKRGGQPHTRDGESILIATVILLIVNKSDFWKRGATKIKLSYRETDLLLGILME